MTKQVRTTLDRLIRQVDPEFDRDRRRELEYRFDQREFYANPRLRGAYAPDDEE